MDDLATVLGCLHSDDERRLFLAAILTPAEVGTLTNRWRIFKELLSRKTQREVRAIVGVGIGTVSHAARLLQETDSSILQVVASRCDEITPAEYRPAEPPKSAIA